MPQAKAASTRRSSKSSTSSGSSPQRAAPKPSSTAPAPGPEDAPDAASPWAPVSHRERQREAKRNAVLQAAAQLFNERGFHATSLDDIAARLQCTPKAAESLLTRARDAFRDAFAAVQAAATR